MPFCLWGNLILLDNDTLSYDEENRWRGSSNTPPIVSILRLPLEYALYSHLYAQFFLS